MTDPFTQAEAEKKVLTADSSATGRLDAWLTAALSGKLSRNRLQALIRDGSVRVNGAVVNEPRRAVAPGDLIELDMPEAKEAKPTGEALPLDILYEDDDLIVISKAAGMVVHPGAGNHTGTLVNALLHHCGDSLSGIGGVKRPGIVHRLDKNTSGVMVVAKNDFAHNRLAEQFADHGRSGPLRRAYLALVWGCPSPLKGTIDAPIGRSPSHRTKRSVHRSVGPDTRHAVTHYEVRQRFGAREAEQPVAALVDCRLETGRTHQIRVHLEHLGNPLIGDPEYGTAFRTKINTLPADIAAAVAKLNRQALHAYLLQFSHPRDAHTMRFEAPVPTDISEVISAFS
ncbi:RluA family pseudouridine synthase [Hoeflea prorocentri]|uniref:Pseudouridine synthase n=1 Tax=Hoeflea prorocentri TaxID=1922333 RepID=A0A9X3ZF60_9HYPH|nr:RluA family pseudouridine synthase [Hoeflea prorocentri]MCY6379331.1 RluA family pseudouridine synthase [Hoeflea prorocentri]MDA5397132.1 RluA family pseudouridine synthase [Hoeflea prorocentri]